MKICPKCYPVQAERAPQSAGPLCREHELTEVLRGCLTSFPSLLDGDAAKERLKEINVSVYAAFRQ